MLCGKCGYTNLQDASYCTICGSKLDGEPTLGEPVGSVPCPHCEKLNEPIAVHCRFCGKKMKSAKKRAAKKRETTPEEKTVSPSEAIVPEQPDTPSEPESLEMEEMKVLLGLDAAEENFVVPDASDPPPTIEDLEAEMDELDSMLSSLHDDENSDAVPEPESEPSAEIAQPPVTEPPVVASDPGGMVTDPDEMAKLIASIKSEEPEPTPEPEPSAESEPEADSATSPEVEPAPEPDADSVPETPAEENADISDEDLSGYPSTPHESVAANPRELGEEDEEEEQPVAQEEVTLPEASEVAGKALSTSLDSMISELLEAEVKEPGEHDYVLHEESAFPPRTRAAYKKKNVINAKDLFFNLFVATTTLLCGFSVGLWLSYFFM